MDVPEILAIVFAVLGVIGDIVPALPGPPLSGIAILCLYLSDSAGNPVSTAALCVWIAFAVIITIADYIIPGRITRLTGGHKEAERGALIGLFAGIILTPIGMILGCILGAFIGEYCFQKNSAEGSAKAAAGAFLGVILSTGIKLIFSLAVLAVVLVKIIVSFT